MWVEKNLNPVGRKTGDCAVRAIANTLGIPWETAYAMLSMNGFSMGDIMNANSVIGSVLRQHGFKKANIPNECPECYTVKEFCENNPNGRFMLGTGTHVVSIIDGNYYDIWDSGDEVPVYVWYNEVIPVFDI